MNDTYAALWRLKGYVYGELFCVGIVFSMEDL